MAKTRLCDGTETDVYEITGDTQVEVYEEALRVVRENYDHSDAVTFDIHTTARGFDVIGQLNVYR